MKKPLSQRSRNLQQWLIQIYY